MNVLCVLRSAFIFQIMVCIIDWVYPCKPSDARYNKSLDMDNEDLDDRGDVVSIRCTYVVHWLQVTVQNLVDCSGIYWVVIIQTQTYNLIHIKAI